MLKHSVSLVLFSLLVICALVNASTPTCRSPSSSSSTMKVGGVALSNEELEDLVGAEILHQTYVMNAEAQAQGRALSDEDLEFLNELTNEENTLRFGRRFRRAFRRLRRGLRRLGRAIGRVVKKVASFAIRLLGPLAKMLGLSSKAKKIVENSVSKWNGKTGPYARALDNRAPFVAEKKACVACRVDCMKHYANLNGAIFDSCKDQYHYYGCQAVAPCFTPSSASDSEIEGMIGICVVRNGCHLKKKFEGSDATQLLRLQRLIGNIRASGVSDPQ